MDPSHKTLKTHFYNCGFETSGIFVLEVCMGERGEQKLVEIL